MHPYVIAEIGSNWRTKADCLTSITAAKVCGADAVKFQLFTGTELFGLYPGVIEGELPAEWLPDLSERATKTGIDFLCSAFSPDGMKAVDPYVKAHKIASAECTHLGLLETARALKKPLILSTGGHGNEDIGAALRAVGTQIEVTLMYCVANYPARYVDMRRIGELKERFEVPVGFSDHTTDVLNIPRLAVQAGACIVEKHVSFVDQKTPDSEHSLNEREFRQMIASIRGPHPEQPQPYPEEKDMLLLHNRRLIAIKAINPGDILEEGYNYGSFRSAITDSGGISPLMAPAVNGRKALFPIAIGRSIRPECIG